MKKTVFIILCLCLMSSPTWSATPPGGTMYINDLSDCPADKACVDDNGNFKPASGTDPDISGTGGMSYDTDGGNVGSDAIIRASDGTNQWMAARKITSVQFFVLKPNDLADAQRDALNTWYNDSGMTFNITRILTVSDTDNTDVAVKEITGRDNATVLATVETVAIDTDGTGCFYKTITTASIDNPVIETGHGISLDFDDTDDPGYVQITLEGWYDANVD